MDEDTIGERIINLIINSGMVRTDEKESTVLVWSANAAEQITALVKELRERPLQHRIFRVKPPQGEPMTVRGYSVSSNLAGVLLVHAKTGRMVVIDDLPPSLGGGEKEEEEVVHMFAPGKWDECWSVP